MVYLKSIFESSGIVEASGPSGSGKTRWLLRELGRAPQARIAWIENGVTAYPCAFAEHGVSVQRVLFVDCPSREKVLWSARQILKSQAFGVVVFGDVKPGLLDEMDLRRLQLMAEKSKATIVLLSEQPTRQGAWPISVQLEIARSREAEGENDSISVHVLRQRSSAALGAMGGEAWQRLGLLPTG